MRTHTRLALLLTLLFPTNAFVTGVSVSAPQYPVSARELLLGSVGVPGPSERALRVKAPETFTMIGISYRGAPVDFEVRVERDETWTHWTHLETEPAEGPDLRSPESKSAKRSTIPLWTGAADSVELRMEEQTGSSISDVRLHLIDASGESLGILGRLAARLHPRSHPAYALSRPGITTREQWGADESLRNCESTYAPAVNGAFIHHTATDTNYTPEESPAIVRSIYYYHSKVNGWCDIGYNFLIDRFGTVYEGRSGGMDRAVVGAHARGFNTESIGVSMIGNFVDADPPSRAIDSLITLLGWKFTLHGVHPRVTTSYTSGGSDVYPEGTQVTLPTIAGHRDVGITACPGRLQDQLPVIRGRVTVDYPDGTVIKGTGSAVYLMENGMRRGIPTAGIFESRFRWSEIVEVPDLEAWALSEGPAVGYRDGSLIETPGGTVWFVSEGKRRGFTHADVFESLGYSWSNIRAVSWPEANLHPEGVPIVVPTGLHPEGTVAKGSGPAVYLLSGGKKHAFPSPGAFESGYRWEEIVTVPDSELASRSESQPIGYRDGSLLLTPEGVLWLISKGERRGFTLGEAVAGLGYSWSNVRPVSWGEASLHPEGPPV